MTKAQAEYSPVRIRLNRANYAYNETLDANDKRVEEAEQWINDHQGVFPDFVSKEIEERRIRRSMTSGHLFIQLRRK